MRFLLGGTVEILSPAVVIGKIEGKSSVHCAQLIPTGFFQRY
jgi:hypothetical protein